MNVFDSKSRLNFIKEIIKGNDTATAIKKEVGLSKPCLFRHLKKLKKKDLIILDRKEGVKKHYKVNTDKLSDEYYNKVKEINDKKEELERLWEEKN